jgi:hypothetical protein
MNQQLPIRFWIELILGVLSAASVALALARPQWVESVLGIDPDGGDGSSEWKITLTLIVATLALFATAGHEWRKRSNRSSL